MKERVQLREEELVEEKKNGKFVPKKVWDKHKVEERCMNCGRNNHHAQDCKAPLSAEIPPFPSNTNQEPFLKKRKFDKGHFKIMELGSEEDSETK